MRILFELLYNAANKHKKLPFFYFFVVLIALLEICLWVAFIFLLSKLLFGCSDRKVVSITADVVVVDATHDECPSGGYVVNGVPVCHGVSIGVQITPDYTCTAGGSLVSFFKDYNQNSVKEYTEPFVGFYSTCNGETVNVMVATPTECPHGGVTINSIPVCNGAPGAGVTVVSATVSQCPNGGIVVNGTPICNGLNGAGVQVVTLCPADTSALAEKAILVGGELYAVLYSNPNAHPHNIGLVLLTPGTWMTTTNGSKIFTYSKSGSTITLTCESVTATYTF